MGFKITMEIDSDLAPDAVGEYLRRDFFAKEVGCYSCFDWRKGVEPLPALLIDEDHNHPLDEEPEELCWACDSEGAKWTRGKKNGIECRWYWDGDGVLAFGLPGGSWLVNYDCKKDHGWTVVANEREIC